MNATTAYEVGLMIGVFLGCWLAYFLRGWWNK